MASSNAAGGAKLPQALAWEGGTKKMEKFYLYF